MFRQRSLIIAEDGSSRGTTVGGRDNIGGGPSSIVSIPIRLLRSSRSRARARASVLSRILSISSLISLVNGRLTGERYGLLGGAGGARGAGGAGGARGDDGYAGLEFPRS